VGLGLAFPFVLLGIWPGLVKWIPRPGAWTGVFRTVMGFLLVGTAVYLVDVLAAQVGGSGVIRVLVFLATLGLAAWVYGRFGGPTASRGARWGALAAAVGIAVAGGLLSLRLEGKEPGEAWQARVAETKIVTLPAGWETFAPERVEGYVASGEPVFLAFGARWCWTCKVNEAGALADPAVLEALRSRGVHLVYGDFTSADSTVAEWLRRFDRAGVPLYVYFPRDGRAPVVLPEILTRRMVIDALEG